MCTQCEGGRCRDAKRWSSLARSDIAPQGALVSLSLAAQCRCLYVSNDLLGRTLRLRKTILRLLQYKGLHEDSGAIKHGTDALSNETYGETDQARGPRL